MRKLEGKTAIITGISSGIGRATAILFAKEGANIVGSDINSEGGKTVIETIEGLGGNSVFIKSDISITEDVKHLVKRAHEFKTVDVLFNNAGIEVVKKLEDTSEEEWERTIDVNLKSVFLCTKYIIPGMRENGGGTIINNSSAAALVGSFSPVYSASKGGIVALTKSLAIELAPDNIRVNCVCPGAIETPMLQRVIEKQGDPKIVRDTRTSLYPLGRFGKSEEIAKAVLFLACDDSSFVTGGVFVIDGGFTSR